jgi:predicted nucleic acid-binding Zn ribbon protein
MRRMDRPEAFLAWLKSGWPGMAGPVAARHCMPMRCEGGVLEIRVYGEGWVGELEDLRETLMGRINSAWGREIVRKIQVLGAAKAALPHSADPDHLPFIRKKAGTQVHRGRKKVGGETKRRGKP